MYKINADKIDRIQRFGITADLPLFNQPQDIPSIQHPSWLWSGSGLKADIYNKLKQKFAEDSFLYLNALINLGGKATDHQVKEYFSDSEKWPLHIVSARRNYFTKAPWYLVKSFPGQEIIGPSGRPNTVWSIDYRNLFQLTLE